MSVLLQPGQRQGEVDSCSVIHVKLRRKFTCPGQNRCSESCLSLQVNQQRQKLHDLQTLIDNLGSGQDTVSDKAFEDRLKEAERAILELLEEAQTSKGKTVRVQNTRTPAPQEAATASQLQGGS